MQHDKISVLSVVMVSYRMSLMFCQRASQRVVMFSVLTCLDECDVVAVVMLPMIERQKQESWEILWIL